MWLGMGRKKIRRGWYSIEGIRVDKFLFMYYNNAIFYIVKKKGCIDSEKEMDRFGFAPGFSCGNDRL